MALTDKLTAIANSIRSKTGGSGALTLPQMAAQINTLQPPMQVTNVLTTAIDTDGTPYNGGTGFKQGFRLTSSGTESSNASQSVTGYIPVAAGDVVRVLNIGAVRNYACYLLGYDSSFNKTATFATSFDNTGFSFLGGIVPASNVAYVRFNFMKNSENVVVTRNQAVSPLELSA